MNDLGSHELKPLEPMNNSGLWVIGIIFSHYPRCRPSILSLDICMYLGGVARTQFLYVTTMEPLLGLIGFRTSREFTYGSIQCQCLIHYEMSSQPIPWFMSYYKIWVEVSTKALVQLELTEAHPNPEHSGLFQSFLHHLCSELWTIFLLDSLFFKEYSIQI